MQGLRAQEGGGGGGGEQGEASRPSLQLLGNSTTLKVESLSYLYKK